MTHATKDIAPARRIVEEALAVNDAAGHDNAGSLSYSHGFLPRQEPLYELPASHRAWDEIAGEIPHLYRAYAVRKVIGDMPILSAKADTLPDYYLSRASSLFSILAHLYWYCEPEPPEAGIPPQIQIPWEQISQRLNRPAPHLSFIDLNSHNWHFIDPTLKQPFVVENLKLAIPMIGNEDERRFQTAPIEMMYLFSPLMDAMLSAQEAAMFDDPSALEKALTVISGGIKHLTYVSLMKVNPNPYNDLYINPVVWGKTAALFASPFQTESIPGPSGTAIPTFTALDIFFGRRSYGTTVGHETNRTRAWFPKYWRDFLIALEAISVTDYVVKYGGSILKGIFEDARDSYAGESGILSRHRLKAYGFLDLSFKAGRMKTLGGVSGGYSQRIWDRMATELDESRMERYGDFPASTQMVPVKRVESVREHAHQFVRRVVFDIAGTGLRYQAGDRCGILPENSDELVRKTLSAMRAYGNEIIQLNGIWRWHMHLRHGYEGVTELPLHTLLKFGRIRPLDRTAAFNLYHLTSNDRLRRILDAWAEDQWEVWDILEVLAEGGYNTRRLWKAIPGDYEHICRIITPERWRLYSISSIQDDSDELHLTVGGFHYHTPESEVSREADRSGTGSGFLARLASEKSASAGYVSIKIVHPPRFSLPPDSSRPVVMFAGGTGIAPMRGLIDERLRGTQAAPMWLFFGTRQKEDFYYQDEFERLSAQGRLSVQVAFSRDDVRARFDGRQFVFAPGKASHLDEIMLEDDNARLLWELLRSPAEGGQGAYFYLCGRTSFASAMLDAIRAILKRYTGSEEDARQILYRLIGEDRFMLEIYTSYAGTHFDDSRRQINISEVALHNDDEYGYWIIVSGRVYDMNEFNHMHPGGAKIIQSYSGMDATIAYQKIEHHLNSEVDSMLGMYELGVLRPLEFGTGWGVALSEKGLRVITLREVYFAWVNLLFMVIEIENAIRNDFRVRNEPLTDIETHTHVVLTPAKVQQMGQAHERLVTGYLDHVLGEPMQNLWTTSIGLMRFRSLDARWMGDRIQEIQTGDEAAAVLNVAHDLRQRIKQDETRLSAVNGHTEKQFGVFCDLLQEEDSRLIRELKLALREGVMVFEEFEAETIAAGADRLLEIMQSFPAILSDFYARMANTLAEMS